MKYVFNIKDIEWRSGKSFSYVHATQTHQDRSLGDNKHPRFTDNVGLSCLTEMDSSCSKQRRHIGRFFTFILLKLLRNVHKIIKFNYEYTMNNKYKHTINATTKITPLLDKAIINKKQLLNNC